MNSEEKQVNQPHVIFDNGVSCPNCGMKVNKAFKSCSNCGSTISNKLMSGIEKVNKLKTQYTLAKETNVNYVCDILNKNLKNTKINNIYIDKNMVILKDNEKLEYYRVLINKRKILLLPQLPIIINIIYSLTITSIPTLIGLIIVGLISSGKINILEIILLPVALLLSMLRGLITFSKEDRENILNQIYEILSRYV